MELKVWVEGIQRIVCGVTNETTCQVNINQNARICESDEMKINNNDMHLNVGCGVCVGSCNWKNWTIYIN